MEQLETSPVSPESRELLAHSLDHLTPNYRPKPLILSRGKGTRVFDRDGNSFLDMAAGIAVNSLGHAHPRLVKAMTTQLRSLMHVSNLYLTEPIIAFTQKLAELSGFSEAFLTNSGTESTEAALKLARRYQYEVKNKPKKTAFLAFNQGFHGRSLGALSVTGQAKYHEGFRPLLQDVYFANYNDLASVDAILAEKKDEIAAIILEPVQCEGGIHLATQDFLEGLRARATENDIVLIFDEVQTGVARSGSWYAYQHFGVKPDVMTSAKGLGGGMPIGAMLTDPPFSAAFQPGSHGSTFGGNPLACRAGLEVLSVIEDENLLGNTRRMGEKLQQGLAQHVGRYAKEVRGIGLIWGLELGDPEKVAAFIKTAQNMGMLVHSANQTVVRYLPPLNISEEEVDEALNTTDRVLSLIYR